MKSMVPNKYLFYSDKGDFTSKVTNMKPVPKDRFLY